MAERQQIGKISLVNKTTAEWQTETTIPFKGCPCVEFTADGKTKLKIGDGAKLYTELPYVADELTAALIIAALGYTPLDSAKLGVAEGAASLDAAGKIPAVQLPSFVDEIINVGLYVSIDESGNRTITKAVDKDGLDISPEEGKIYVNAYKNIVTDSDGTETEEPATERTYRWSGTIYVEVSASDIVTASEKNGYIKINGTDVKVYEPDPIDDALSETSEHAVQNKVVTEELAKKIDESDTIFMNCTL